MNKRIPHIAYLLSCTFLFLALILCLPSRAFADNLDEILKYEITAEVCDDAQVKMDYHVEWRVLDSDSYGPLEWVQIGMPNSRCEIESSSDNIDEIYLADTYLYIYFTDSYYEGEAVSFDFTIMQDYLYQINAEEEGYTQYSFTPGWFDELVVDEMTIRWKADKVSKWSPDCLVKQGYNTWTTSLEEGESFTIKVTYPNDAFAFDESVSEDFGYENNGYDNWDSDRDNDWEYISGNDWDDDFFYEDDYDNSFSPLSIVIVLFAIFSMLGKVISNISDYNEGADFGENTEKTTTKITRTRVVYYTNCPNCAAPREEGKESCPYCGTNLIQSEDIIKEETLTKEEKETMKKYTKDGEYAYASQPNTFIRVHTVVVPVSRGPIGGGSRGGGPRGGGPRGGGPRSGGGSRGGGSRGGGCAHSSCACACASCACACACACAGGGRAGCSNKDFYKNSLKLAQLEKRTKSK